MNYAIEIVIHTPVWVWVLLAFLIYRGVAALQTREIQPSRALIVPLVFLIWGGRGLLERAADQPVALIAYGVALAAGLAIGWGLSTLAAPPTFIGSTGLLRLPGSPISLIVICAAFAAKYGLAVALGTTPELGASAAFATLSGATGGLTAGIFWGRAYGQFAGALHADGFPATLPNVAALAFGREPQSREVAGS